MSHLSKVEIKIDWWRCAYRGGDEWWVHSTAQQMLDIESDEELEGTAQTLISRAKIWKP